VIVTFERRVSASSDDAEQATGGAVDLSSSDLELVTESTVQTVGIRFTNVVVPKNATIANAYVQFQVDEATSGATSLRIEAQAADAPLTFSTATNNVSSRPRTIAFANWAPAAWPTVGAAGPAQRTVNIANVIQEIVSRANWVSGNPLAIIVTGSGVRVAEAFDGLPAAAPLLHVEYAAAGGGTTTTTTSTTVTTTTSTTTSSTLPGGVTTLEIRVNASNNDAEQASNGSMDLTSSDLELVTDGSTVQSVGMRFVNVAIPPGRIIVAAYVQFQVDEATTAATSLRIDGQASIAPLVFTTATNNISSRPRTTAFVNWSPPSWPTVGAAGTAQRTPSLVPIIQEIVSLPGWASGNALALIVTGTGSRVAEAFNGVPAAAPLLHVEYQ
jgi:hypothetical protein